MNTSGFMYLYVSTYITFSKQNSGEKGANKSAVAHIYLL